jgi:hypothetical protein
VRLRQDKDDGGANRLEILVDFLNDGEPTPNKPEQAVKVAVRDLLREP